MELHNWEMGYMELSQSTEKCINFTQAIEKEYFVLVINNHIYQPCKMLASSLMLSYASILQMLCEYPVLASRDLQG